MESLLKEHPYKLKPRLIKDYKKLNEFLPTFLPPFTSCPIFVTSNVTGVGINLLRDFLIHLKPTDLPAILNLEKSFLIDIIET